METLGDIIKRSRKLKKMTLVQLGEETELSHGYLSNLENNNRNNPSSEVLKKIADVLEIPHSELLAAAGHLDKRTLYEELTLELDKNNRDLAQTRQELSFLARKIEEQSKKNTKDTDFLQYISEQKFREDILSNLQHKSYELEVKLYELKEELAAVGHLDKRALYKELTLEFEKNDMDLEQTEQELAYLARKIEEQSETSTKDEVFLDNLTEESNLKKDCLVYK